MQEVSAAGAGRALARLSLPAVLRPALPDDPALRLPAAGPDAGMRVTFLGTSTLLLDDGDTQLLTDGFLTRPSALRTALGRLAPDQVTVDRCLARAGVTRLAAVAVLHSHYDHVLDVAAVTLRTGATLIGSTSSGMVGRGGGVPEDRIVVPALGEPLRFGRFTLRFLPSEHVPPPRLGGEIRAPLVPPARVSAYRCGPCYSLLVQHDAGTLLVQSSAGFLPGDLAGQSADVVYLAVGMVGRRPVDYRDAYWREVVAAVGARRVLPVHWDDFTLPLDQPLVPLPHLLDRFDVSLQHLRDRGAAEGVDVRLPTEWQPTDPFAGLPGDAGRTGPAGVA